jgi:hypothetical protein
LPVAEGHIMTPIRATQAAHTQIEQGEVSHSPHPLPSIPIECIASAQPALATGSYAFTSFAVDPMDTVHALHHR